MIEDRKLSSLVHFLPSTAISLKLRSPATLIFFALASSCANWNSSSNFLLAPSPSASSPAIRELVLVGLVASLFTGGSRFLGVFDRGGFGAAVFGMIFFAVVLKSFIMA
jgi:hypothetical protein